MNNSEKLVTQKSVTLDSIIDHLLTGASDMHIHSSPDIIPRKLSDLDVARQAEKAGMAAVMLKNHYDITTSRAKLASEIVKNIYVFGGVVLNCTLGGLNPFLVDTQLQLGAKEIWLPTASAVNFYNHGKCDLKKVVRLKDDNGKWVPELHQILELIAKKDAILGTGHIYPEESEEVIELALKKGVKKIIFTHPEFELTKAPLEMQKRLAYKGVMFERCYYSSNPSPFKFVPVEEIANEIKIIGIESTIMATDFGQVGNDYPVIGMKRYIKEMLLCGLKPTDIERMVNVNPAQMLGI